jgi:hypothetical protein
LFLHLSERQVSEFCARWDEINNWLNKFLTFQPNQRFVDEQTKDILYTIIPKCWQSYLQCNKFDIIGCSIRIFFEVMECYQISDQLDPLLKPKDQSKTDKDESNKSLEKPNDKKHKAKPKKNDSQTPAPKKPGMLHGSNSSHMTEECRVVQEHIGQMKEAWKKISRWQNALVRNANANANKNKNKKNRMNSMRWWS